MEKEAISIFPANSVPDFSDSVIYFRKPKDRNSPVFRYYQVTEQFQNQLNGYRYCWNNPVRYTDPTGNFIPGLAEVIIHLLVHPVLEKAWEEAWEWIDQQLERWCGPSYVNETDFWGADALSIYIPPPH